jgi:ATP-dependent Lon protease
VANILQLLKLPDGTVKVLVEGGFRARVDYVNDDDAFTAGGRARDRGATSPTSARRGLMRSATSLFEKYVKLNKKVPPEVLTSLSGIDEPGRLADTMAAHMG